MSETIPRQIAIYGRGGVGVTTIASNISAALADDGLKVVQVGCDSRYNSCGSLHTVTKIPTVMESLRTGRRFRLEDLIIMGYKGISCIELGDPFIHADCTSRALADSLEALQELDYVEQLSPDLVVYDIPWESGCAGFVSQVYTTASDQVFMVASADLMSLQRVNGILRGMVRDAESPSLQVGLIANGVSNAFEESFVVDYAHRIGVKPATTIPRSLVVRQCELYGKTVIEAAPLSNQAAVLRRLARQVAAGDAAGTFTPLTPEELRRWGHSWGDLLFQMENGLFSDGAAI